MHTLPLRRSALWLAGLVAAWASTCLVLPARAEELELPVPRAVVYPGDVLADEMLIERAFIAHTVARATVFEAREAVIGKVARHAAAGPAHSDERRARSLSGGAGQAGAGRVRAGRPRHLHARARLAERRRRRRGEPAQHRQRRHHKGNGGGRRQREARRPMTRRLYPLLLALVGCLSGWQAQAATRIKDIISVQGVRANQLVGYGLVIGLNGTGDSLRNSPFTEQ